MFFRTLARTRRLPDRFGRLLLLIAGLALLTKPSHGIDWNNHSGTWVATDAVGRKLPDFGDVGPIRPDRTVGVFYFLWLGPHSQQGGPWDISKILTKDPNAMQKPDSPLWGPMFAPHHWGESIFGYYNSDDPYVLRKHAQMLSDAGVDVVIFDVTNQLTYRQNYLALLREWSAVRSLGNRTPQVAFLCPFWEPAKVVRELYRDLYLPKIHPDLWFSWKCKPLILADPEKLGFAERFAHRDFPAELKPGDTLGQSFRATNHFVAAGGSFPTWQNSTSRMTLTLRRGGPGGEVVARQSIQNVQDNAWVSLRFNQQPPGTYYLEMSDSSGKIGWWSHRADGYPTGHAFANGQPTEGDRNFEIFSTDPEVNEIHEFFTFRRPQPDYFRGQTAPDMWSWLEVFPQHLFTNRLGEREQISVGVAQNAVSNRLGSMSESAALGRSFHSGAWDRTPGAVNRGFNFAEQFDRALRENPTFIFITGWNEWIAGRHPEFNGIKEPVMFVDQFDQEHSRDIEPMKGGHGDNYYYQMVGNIRRFKGVSSPPPPGRPKPISLDSSFDQWADVTPEFRDDIGDVFHRDFPGYAGHQVYVNRSGRNDIVVAKVSPDREMVSFYVRTREALTPTSGTNWMWLLIDSDQDHSTGWEGYDWIVNRVAGEGTASLERNAGGWRWTLETNAAVRITANEMHLAIPRKLLSSNAGPLAFDFKWADNMPTTGDIVSWLDAGDAAPSGRFNFRYAESGAQAQ